MKRAYRFGAAVLAVVAAGLVFAILFAPVPLTEYEAADEEFRKLVIFLHDDKEIFPLSVVYEPLPAPDQARLVVVLGDRAGIRIENVAIGIRGPVEVYLEDCGVDSPPIRFQHVTGADMGAFLRSRIRGSWATGR